MLKNYRAEAKYRRALRDAIADNHKAMYHALVVSDPRSMDAQLAEFLMSEAHWEVSDFLRRHIEGAFGV